MGEYPDAAGNRGAGGSHAVIPIVPKEKTIPNFADYPFCPSRCYFVLKNPSPWGQNVILVHFYGADGLRKRHVSESGYAQISRRKPIIRTRFRLETGSDDMGLVRRAGVEADAGILSQSGFLPSCGRLIITSAGRGAPARYPYQYKLTVF